MNQTNPAGCYVWYRAYHRRVASVTIAAHQAHLQPLEPNFELVQMGDISLDRQPAQVDAIGRG